MASSLDLLRRLIRARVEFVLVGGMAGVVHGSSMVTRDVDICAPATEENMARLLAAVQDLHPLDGAGSGAEPLQRRAGEIAASTDLRLTTDLGRLDVIWDVPGIGAWPDVRAAASVVSLDPDAECHVLGLAALIASKRALGRTRDLMAVEELEEIHRRLRGRS